MRFLAVDVGDRRTGFAAGDDISGVVTPIGVEHVAVTPGGDLEPLAAVIVRHAAEADADTIAVGLPLNMDGSVGPRAEHARAVARAVFEDDDRPAGVAVVLVDERKTSERADELMARTGMTYGQKKKKRDALAAVAIGWVLLESGPLERVE